jgi:hypothetical protein
MKTRKKLGTNLRTQQIEIALLHLPRRRSKNGASLRGSRLRRVVLLRLTNGEEDGLEDINVRFKRHNMPLNGAACYDGISLKKKMRKGEDKKLSG